jgi:hypothetical protein
MKIPKKNSHPVVKLVQAVLEAQRALSDIPLSRLMKTLEATLGAMPAIAQDRKSWQKFAVHAFEQHQRQETLEQLIAVCRVHRGAGLRKARIIKSAAIALRRECGKNDGEIDDQGAKELKRLLEAYEQVQAK